MKYDPYIHHRHSIRLKDYDYSQRGAYFVTICVQNKECLFGEIADGIMLLNDAGKMVEKWWIKLSDKFGSIMRDEYVVMPNHFHGIVAIVGADPCVVPNMGSVGADPCVCPNGKDERITREGAHMGVPLQRTMQWFKTMTTNEYIQKVKECDWPPFRGRLWQRNYYEHVIRSNDDLEKIREYIVQNPARWAEDEENPRLRLPADR